MVVGCGVDAVFAEEEEDGGGVYDRMAIGEEGRPQGVGVGGRRARGVKGGEGREERPVPPIMAMGTGSV